MKPSTDNLITIKVLPHQDVCPKGAEIHGKAGDSILDAMLDANIELEHACEKSCACTTCHLVIRQGFDDFQAATDEEEDLLDLAWGLEEQSRLSCQTILNNNTKKITVEIPKYTRNQVSESH